MAKNKVKNLKKSNSLVVPKYINGTNNTWINRLNEMGNGVVSSINNTPNQNNQPTPNMGSNYGTQVGMNIASSLPQLTSTFSNPNATTGDKVGASVNTVSNAAIGAIPGFGQMYGAIRGVGSMAQGFIPEETKYDRNTGQAVQVKKSGTAGEKTGAVFNQLITPDHEHATNSWKLAADADNTNDKLKYGFQGVGDLFGITKIGRMVEAAKGNDPDGRDLTNIKPNAEYQEQLQFTNYKNGGYFGHAGINMRDIPNGAIQNYSKGGNLETYSLAAHSQLANNFANTHLDGKPVQIEKKETILRKKDGGDYVFSDNPKLKNPLTGNTFAEDSKKIETQTKKPFYDKASERTKEFQLTNLMKINDTERAKAEQKKNGGTLMKYPNGGKNDSIVFTNEHPELVDFSQRPQLELLSMDTQYPDQLTTNQGLLPLSGIQGNFNKLPETKAGSNWGNTSNFRDTLTTGDKLQLAGILPGTLYNTVRAFQKPEKQKLYTDKSPITQQAIAKNLNPAYLAYNAGRDSINNATSSDAVRRATLAQMTSNLQKNVQDYSLNVDNQNKGLRTQFEDRLANQNRFNIGQKVMTDDINAKNKAAQRAFGAAAATNLGQGITSFGQALNQGKTNEIGYSALQSMAANFGLDPKEYADFLRSKGVKIKYTG